MALVKCSECGHNVATDAPSCPSCGHRMPQPPPAETRGSGRKALLGITGLLILIWILSSLGKGSSSSTNTATGTMTGKTTLIDTTAVPSTSAVASTGTYADRKRFAEEYEKKMLLKGMDMKVTTMGPEARTLKLTYALANRPLAYQLSQDRDAIANLQSLGFRRVIVSDGYDESYSVTIDPLPGNEQAPAAAKPASRKRYQWVADPTLEIVYYATPQCRPARELLRTKRGQIFETIDQAFGAGYRRSDTKDCDD